MFDSQLTASSIIDIEVSKGFFNYLRGIFISACLNTLNLSEVLLGMDCVN